MRAHKGRVKAAVKEGGQQGSLPADLFRVNLNASGVDLGVGSHFVAVSEGRCEPPVREFTFVMAHIYRIADRPQFRRMLDEASRPEAPFKEILIRRTQSTRKA